MRVLLTGGGGFVGQWVARRLIKRGDDVVCSGIGMPSGGPRILTDDEWKSVEWLSADMRRQSDVDGMVARSAPTLIIHLAGIAFPPHAEREPAAAYDINTLGVVRLIAAIETQRRSTGIDPTLLVIGSSTQYGMHDPSEMPLPETAAQRPSSVYAASKAAQELIALSHYRATGVRVVCTRSFNHSGVGHAAEYLLPSLVRRATEAGGIGKIAIGNDVVRDYLHVRDVADAYIALGERGRAGEVYNVCSGVGVSVRQLATDVLLRAGRSPDISTDPALIRATDIPVLVGSPAKLVRDTGWAPRKTHADIIDDQLNAATD